MSQTRTFLDSGVLITAARSRGTDQQIALSILRDSNRVFLTTPFLALEVVPKAAFYRQELELSFYERYMASATTYRGLNQKAGTLIGLFSSSLTIGAAAPGLVQASN